jgi:hypothetical protein
MCPDLEFKKEGGAKQKKRLVSEAGGFYPFLYFVFYPLVNLYSCSKDSRSSKQGGWSGKQQLLSR